MKAIFHGDHHTELGVVGESRAYWDVARVPVKITLLLPSTARRGDPFQLEARFTDLETNSPVKAGSKVAFKFGSASWYSSVTMTTPGIAIYDGNALDWLFMRITGNQFTVTVGIINSDRYGDLLQVAKGSIRLVSKGQVTTKRIIQTTRKIARTTTLAKAPVKVYVPSVTARRGTKATLKATISRLTGTKLSGVTVFFRVGSKLVGRKVTNKKGAAAVVYTIPKRETIGKKSIKVETVATPKYKAGKGIGRLAVKA